MPEFRVRAEGEVTEWYFVTADTEAEALERAVEFGEFSHSEAHGVESVSAERCGDE